MKIVCDCGTEQEIIEDEEGFETDNGIYSMLIGRKIVLWEEHDVVGIVCENCKKAVWVFV